TDALRGALRRGYEISHLVRLEGDNRRSIQMVECMLKLFEGAGGYRPRYFSHYGVISSAREMLVVPGAGAMVLLGTGQTVQVDAAVVMMDQGQIEVLRDHFVALRGQTRPLLNSYPGGCDRLNFMEAPLRAEEIQGDNYLSKHDAGDRTRPYSWCRQDSNWARGLSSLGLDPQMMIDLQKRRLDVFYRQVESYRFREICPRSALLRLAREGLSGRCNPGSSFPLEDRVEHLENLLALLNSFDNYQLALPTDSEAKEHLSPNFWGVKWGVDGDPAVLMEVGPTEDGGEESILGLEILEPLTCAAFRDHFLDLFDHKLSPLSKDKREVIAFLQSQVDWLRERMGTEGCR
ncbi:MAG: hypothetical protein ACYC66_15700, partial [Chloroflexota bacterium]